MSSKLVNEIRLDHLLRRKTIIIFMFIMFKNRWIVTANELAKNFNMTIFCLSLGLTEHEIDIHWWFICNENESQALIVYYLEDDKLQFQEKSGRRKCIPQLVNGLGHHGTESPLLSLPFIEHLFFGESLKSLRDIFANWNRVH